MGKLFGTSGIREIVNEKLTPELSLKVGKALGTYLGEGKVVVGADTRTSNEMLKSALISGLLSTGIDVIDIGIAPTPLTGFAIKLYEANAGVTITASHNPPEYNGIKVWQANGMAFTSEMESKLERIIFEERYKKVPWNEIGKLEKADPTKAYIGRALEMVSLDNPYTVVVDCGNGAGSLISPYLQRELGNKVVSLNSHPCGYFSRELEPNAKSLEALAKTVKVLKADVGIAHDGDADRIGVVDDQGNFVDAHICILADISSENHPPPVIQYQRQKIQITLQPPETDTTILPQINPQKTVPVFTSINVNLTTCKLPPRMINPLVRNDNTP